MSKNKNAKAERAGGNVREDSELKIHQDKYNDEKKAYIRKFQSKFTNVDVEELISFMSLSDDIHVLKDGLVKYSAFNQDDFKGAVGSTSFEVYATKQFAKEYAREYVMQMFNLLLTPLEAVQAEKETKPDFK